MKVKKLSKFLKKNGFDYFLVERIDDCAIYEQSKIYAKKRKIIAFEVFKIKKYDLTKLLLLARKEKKEDWDFQEAFSSNEEYGKTAWTYQTLKDAKKKFEMLTLSEKNTVCI